MFARDAALVRRVRQGDTAAAGELFDAYAELVFQYLAYQLDGQIELAQDLCEEVFMQAVRHMADLPPDMPLSSALFSLASLRLRDYLSRAGLRQDAVSGEPAQPRLRVVAPSPVG